MRLKSFIAFLFIISNIFAQTQEPNTLQPIDARYKTDILLIVAHPDDETAISSYLAKVIFDEGKKVSIIYTNRGEGGGNSAGNEQSTAMGLMREIESRKGVTKFGIENVWFLDGRDTPGQDVFASLQRLNHGASLEKVVRLVRLTRPEIIITWLPVYCAGENHGDHQASGVIATEAFDLAGDPSAFPTQITFPREPKDINNIGEGMNPWQTKKIYYFSDREKGFPAIGPSFNVSDISSTKKESYVKLAADLMTTYLTQADVSEEAIKAKGSGDYLKLENWLKKFHLIFGKAVIQCNPKGDVFEGITEKPTEFVPVKRKDVPKENGVTISLGGSFQYYKNFSRAHDLPEFQSMIGPEVMIAAGSYFHIPLILGNNSESKVTVKLQSKIPEGWHEYSGTGEYLVEPNQQFPVQTFFDATSEINDKAQEIVLEALVGGEKIGSVTIKVYLTEWNLPQ